MLDRCKHMIVTLEEVVEVRFGIKTGINEFFHLTDEKITHGVSKKNFFFP